MSKKLKQQEREQQNQHREEIEEERKILRKKTLKELQLDAIRNGYSEKNGSIQEKELEEMIRLWKKIPENEKEKFFYTCCAGTVGYEDLARLYEQIVG